MTSLRGPGERNFNAVSHKPTRAPIQSVPVAPVSFGLWDTALKFLSPGPRNDVTDHLDRKEQKNVVLMSILQIELESCFQENATLNYH